MSLSLTYHFCFVKFWTLSELPTFLNWVFVVWLVIECCPCFWAMQNPSCMLLWSFVIAYNLFVEMLSWVLNRFLSINIQNFLSDSWGLKLLNGIYLWNYNNTLSLFPYFCCLEWSCFNFHSILLQLKLFWRTMANF